MSIDVSDENVLGRFDKLTQMGIIHYGPSKAVALVDRDFPVSHDLYFPIDPSCSGINSLAV